MSTLPARALSFGVPAFIVFAALIYDPKAEAADPKRAFGLILAVVGVATWIAWPVRNRAPEWGARSGLAFLAASGLSLAWGLPSGARDLGTFCGALGAGLLATQLGPRGARRTARLSALALGALSAMVAIFASAYGASPMQLHAGQGNPNWLGLLLAVTLPLSLDATLAFRGAALPWRVLTFSAGIVQIPALYLSHSRVAWFAASITSLGLLAFTAAKRLGRPAFLLVPLLFAVIVLTAHSKGDVPTDRALGGRAWIWRNSASAAWHALPLGAGLGRFAHAYLDAQGVELAQLTPGQAARRFINATTAHNEYVQATLESGPLAGVFLAAALVLGARAHAQRRWPGGAAALSACALTSLADSPLRLPAVALLVGLLLGAPGHAPVRSPRRAAPTLVALATLGLVAVLSQNALRGWLATRERTLARDAGPGEQLARLAKSARLDPTSGETLLELGLARLSAADAGGARAAFERADSLFADTATRIALGEAELALDHPSAAGQTFERALAWNAGSFRARLGLASARFRAQRLEDAERNAETARKLLPGDPRARELLDAIREAKIDTAD